MARIMVIGISAGAGKSTFARRLGEAWNMDVYHLDTLYWAPGWVEVPPEQFTASQKEIVNRTAWIIEGNYTSTFDLRATYCDTVIYLELPLYLCLYRVIKRRIQNNGKARPDMAKGCKEKIDKKFITFILKTYYPRKKTMAERLQILEDQGKRVIALKGRQEIETFWQGIGKYEKRK